MSSPDISEPLDALLTTINERFSPTQESALATQLSAGDDDDILSSAVDDSLQLSPIIIASPLMVDTPPDPVQALFDNLLAGSTPPRDTATVVVASTPPVAASPAPPSPVPSPPPASSTVNVFDFPLPRRPPTPAPFVPPSTSTPAPRPSTSRISTPSSTDDEEDDNTERADLERQIERLENILYGSDLSYRQTLDIQRRIAALEDQLAELNDDESRPADRTRESVRRRGSHQEVASAVTRQNLGRGDHRTTTTTRTTTTVRKGKRPVVERTSNSVSAPLSGNDSASSSPRGSPRGRRRGRRAQRGRGRGGVQFMIEHLRRMHNRRHYKSPQRRT